MTASGMNHHNARMSTAQLFNPTASPYRNTMPTSSKFDYRAAATTSRNFGQELSHHHPTSREFDFRHSASTARDFDFGHPTTTTMHTASNFEYPNPYHSTKAPFPEPVYAKTASAFGKYWH